MEKEIEQPKTEIRDKWTQKFLAHLATDRGASVYTQRNYKQALMEFSRWHFEERKSPPVWEKRSFDFPRCGRFTSFSSGTVPLKVRPSKICRCRNCKNGCQNF